MWTVKAEGESQGGFDLSAPPRPKPVPKRIPRGTGQQEALWDELNGGASHVLVTARAGSGKSASCREGMHRMLEAKPSLRVRYAVFNKTAADEFRDACPAGADVGTVHSFGLAALRRAFGGMVEKLKTYLVLDETREGKNLPRYMRKSVALLVSAAKNLRADPRDADTTEGRAFLHEILDRFDVNSYGKPAVIVGHAAAALKKSAEWTQVVDFDDMIWLPPLHGVEFPACDCLFLDEMQDWNPAQHALIPLMCRAGRVVAVGDPHQAIYVWRGADPESMPRLDAVLSAAPGGLKRLPLTITFRCPKSHVRLAQAYVPDFTARDDAPEGVVSRVAGEAFAPPEQAGDLVICPLNAPVIRAALKLIGRRKRAVVKGRAVGDQLVSVLRLCGERRTCADLALAVQRWKGRELARLQDEDGADDKAESVCDRAAGLAAVVSSCASPAEVEPAIHTLFDEKFRHDAVNFSTVHRAKGAEAERVFFLEAHGREPSQEWEFQQANNLQYVALTRSKSELTLVSQPSVTAQE
jgi:DNA helicase II / ATP-dependent DNA helicase PcrA